MERVHLIQHLMQDDPDRPNVTLDSIAGHPRKRKVYLRCHSVRRPASPALHLKLTAQTFRKPKIGNFDLAILDQDVLELKVPVDDVPGL